MMEINAFINQHIYVYLIALLFQKSSSTGKIKMYFDSI